VEYAGAKDYRLLSRQHPYSASQSLVIIAELLLKSGECLAEITGGEADLVSSGSYGALILGSVGR